MPVRSPRRRWITGGAILLLALTVAAACGGGGDEAEAEVTTTTRPTTTTSTTTTTTEPPTLSLLTGLPVDDDEVLERTAVAVKIASDLNAQPQLGLATADIVIEELVEGGISRFLAVFQSTDSDPVGPIRSARTSEVELLPLFGRPIFAHSGGNAGTIRALANSDTLSAGHNSAFGNLYSRDRTRSSGTNNLFTNTSVLRDAAGHQGVAPSAIFTFHDPDDGPPANADTVVGIDVSFGSTRVRWVWDSDRQAFLRWQDGREHPGADGQQLGFTNIVVLVTPYQTSPADPGSPEAVTVGSGEAWVLSNGYVVAGTWERPTAASRYELRDADGNEITLVPGRIWIELPRLGRSEIAFLASDPRESS
jgi:hypothetical protein